MPAFNKGTLSGNMVRTLLSPMNITGAARASDVIDMSNYNHACIIVSCGTMAGATTLQLQYCDDATPTTDTVMKFKYRQMTDGAGATDTLGALTQATSAGISLSTAQQTTIIELDANELRQESVVTDGVANCSRFEVTLSDPSAADYVSITCILSEPRYASQTPQSAIA